MFWTGNRLTGDYEHFYSGDPAFDKDQRTSAPRPDDAPDDWKPPLQFDHEKWVETGDQRYLPLKNGAKPVRFLLRRLSVTDKAFCADRAIEHGGGMAQSTLWALRLAVKDIAPLRDDDPKWSREERYGQEVVSEEWADILQAHDGGALYAELCGRLRRETEHSPK